MSAHSLKDLTGEKYGFLTVMGFDSKIGIVKMWKCKCDCGNTVVVRQGNLRSGSTKSCGCHQRQSSSDKLIDLRGQKFGRLLITEFVGRIKGKTKWKAICDCGNETIVSTSDLRSNNTKSCGCYVLESRIKHGHSRNHKITPEYSVWISMKGRCYNKNEKEYKYYGGRGIIVCDRWLERFDNFFDDMGVRPSKKHSIDRINNDGNYEPSNCRWATTKEQSRNRSDNHYLSYGSVTMVLADWADLFRIDGRLLTYRVKKFSFDKIVESYIFQLPLN